MSGSELYSLSPSPFGRSYRLARRAALVAGLTGSAGAALSATRWAHAQDADDDGEPPYNPGGRIPVDYDETASFNELYNYPPMLGRAEAWRLRVVTDPARYGDVVRYVNYDEVVPLYSAFRADPPRGYAHNDVWFELDDGVIHSSWIVPVREIYNQPEETIGEGFWGEITVPTSWQHWEPKLRSRRYYDLAYGQIFQVVDRRDEDDGRAWYRILDDIQPNQSWWVQAAHVRRIHPAEFEPISASVPPEEKLIVVSISAQTLTCYEYGVPVFTTRIASGTTFFDAEGEAHSFNTPYGEHHVLRKMPSRHMIGGEEINDRYDLPGVAWCTFFSSAGAAIHGTYWHNDFGHPRSHGCVNVTNDAARWVYRWVNPYAGPYDPNRATQQEERDLATRIVVEH